MKSQELLTLTLTAEEAAALKKLLGKHSETTHKEHGLTQKEAYICSDIYDLIPWYEEEE